MNVICHVYYDIWIVCGPPLLGLAMNCCCTACRCLTLELVCVTSSPSMFCEPSLRHGTQNTAWCPVGTQQGVAGLTPRPFTLEEETGSHHGHGHVHRTRMLICMHNWGSSASAAPSAVIYHRHRHARRRRAPPRAARALTAAIAAAAAPLFVT